MSDILVFIICLLDGLLLMILSVYFVSFQTVAIATLSFVHSEHEFSETSDTWP